MRWTVVGAACCCLEVGGFAANAGTDAAVTPRMDPAKFHIGVYGYHYPFLWTEEKVKELKECGLDFVFAVPIQQRQVLDWLHKYGLGCVAVGVTGIDHAKTSEQLSAERPIEKYVADMERFVREQDHPAVWMLNLTDEPTALGMKFIGRVCDEMLRISPQTPPCVNLYPNYARVVENDKAVSESQLGTKTYDEHIDTYCRTSPLSYISYDYYVMFDDPQDVQNWVKKMYANYEVVARACRRTGRDLWYIPQANIRPWCKVKMNANRLRYQAYTAMAYGAVSINWACWGPFWWHGNVYDKNGTRDDELYGDLKTVNHEILALAPYFMQFRNVDTKHIGTGFGDECFGNGHVADLKADDGAELLVGEMVARKSETSKSALFLMASGDPSDSRQAAHDVSFRTGRDAVLVGTKGRSDVVKRSDGRYSFRLRDNDAVLIVLR